MDREKVIKGLETIKQFFGYGLPSTAEMFDSYYGTLNDAIALLKECEVRELTEKEWSKWKKDRNRDPICILWENDTSPIWILNPNDVHEPAFLMGKLKLFNGKPTREQCKAVKWE